MHLLSAPLRGNVPDSATTQDFGRQDEHQHQAPTQLVSLLPDLDSTVTRPKVEGCIPSVPYRHTDKLYWSFEAVQATV